MLILCEVAVVGWAVSVGRSTVSPSFLSSGVEGDPIGERPGLEMMSG